MPKGSDAGLLAFLDKVLLANETMNLTAITDRVEAVRKHLVDSLSVLLLKSLAAQCARDPLWIDVGSGAGFPGMALALAVPGAQMHLIESTGKKAHFLNTAAAELGILRQVQVHNDRAEVLAQIAPSARASLPVPRGTDAPLVPRGTSQSLRASGDAVFFRGVSKLVSLAELGAPLLKKDGLLIAYKGPKAGEELAEASNAMKELKLELHERRDFLLPGIQEARTLLCLRKVGETPKRFPRPTGLAQKEPLV